MFPQPPIRMNGELGILLVVAFALVGIILNLFLAVGVYLEASNRSLRGRKLWFIGPFLWAIFTFMGGIFTAAIYWVMHHSTLGPIETDTRPRSSSIYDGYPPLDLGPIETDDLGDRSA